MKVTLLGDSIRFGAGERQGYGNRTAELLGEDFQVFQPADNCRFAKYMLRMLFDYEKAMEYLNLAGDRENYSEAYKHTRKATIERWFAVGIIGILAVVILCQIIKRIRANRKRY